MTFSMIGMSLRTGEMGICAGSCIPAVGAMVPWAKAGIGAVASQGLLNKAFGPRALSLMTEGWNVERTMSTLLQGDPLADHRQFAIMNATGQIVQHTGKSTFPWAGESHGRSEDFSWAVQGNILAGPRVLQAMVEAFVREGTGRGNLSDRLISALDSGDLAGGDRRGKQSAALLVVHPLALEAPYYDRLCDLRVDDHPQPVRELRRIHDIFRKTAGAETKEGER